MIGIRGMFFIEKPLMLFYQRHHSPVTPSLHRTNEIINERRYIFTIHTQYLQAAASFSTARARVHGMCTQINTDHAGNTQKILFDWHQSIYVFFVKIIYHRIILKSKVHPK